MVLTMKPSLSLVGHCPPKVSGLFLDIPVKSGKGETKQIISLPPINKGLPNNT